VTGTTPVSRDGTSDLARAADVLASRLPPPLAPLARLAFNYWWSWAPGGRGLFQAVDPARFELCRENPVRLLQESPEGIERAARDAALVARAEKLEAALRRDLDRPPQEDAVTAERPAVFLCAEFGVHRSLPIYQGGLGVLAGDILKEASDRAMPLVGVGIMYSLGSFHQRLDPSGWQHDYWIESDPERLPAALVTGADGQPVTIVVPIRTRDVVVQVWRVDVGRVQLFLLDANRPENEVADRWITARLYVGGWEARLAQYALLGIGGVRALRALAIEPGLLHLNDGHPTLAPLELAREAVASGSPFDEALAEARARTIFTTHTPVPAGNETYGAEDAHRVLGRFAKDLGIGVEGLLRLGRLHPDNPDDGLGMTTLGLRGSRWANAVSRRHGEVARAMWHPLHPGASVDDVPIGHVTNGVHVPTWMAPGMQDLLDRYLGPAWRDRPADPESWAGIDAIPDVELWRVRADLRSGLATFLKDRSVGDLLARDEAGEYVEAAASGFSPDVLTVGFARRVATYKRLYLLIQDPTRAAQLLTEPAPIQIVLAGKAHPRDTEAKHSLQRLFAQRWDPAIASRVAYLEDYDMAVAGRLVEGCDVWLNLPRPPMEASGTSGMKSALNGGLNLSVLDGWWAEAFDGTNGWGIPGEVDPDPAAQDGRHAEIFYDLLEREVVPLFYERGEAGVPAAWVARIKASLRSIGPRFGATRMMEDYLRTAYRAPD
jgi:glycogen phosphorylase